MSFAEWKKRSNLFKEAEQKYYFQNCLPLVQAAYKAGERDGKKQTNGGKDEKTQSN